MTLSDGVALSIRPFKAAAPDKALADLKQLLRIARIGPETLENTTHADVSYGISRAWVQDAREYWLGTYDW
jgi:microsomal epoxide hydrolase